ncbi:DUF4817 domain-containing protein [Trichonephila clavipes]|nr:DUF4817 domain-containing protein [Trichonephila clavipes]
MVASISTADEKKCTHFDFIVCAFLVDGEQTATPGFAETEEDLDKTCNQTMPVLKCLSDYGHRCPDSAFKLLSGFFQSEYETQRKVCTKNDDLRQRHNVTVNGDRYRAIITNFFIPELNNHDVQELWFQQDGATCHTARATIDLLKDTFGDRLISRFGPVNWPPRSCDLTPLDYFLWSYVKSLVYADKPQTLDHLEDNIRRVIADIRPQMLEKVIKNWTSDWTTSEPAVAVICPEIIFKM